MMIKFLQRYDKLEEVNRKDRLLELGLTYRIKDSHCIISK